MEQRIKVPKHLFSEVELKLIIGKYNRKRKKYKC